MQHPEEMAEYDPIRNIVYVNESEFSFIKIEEKRAAVLRNADTMPVRTI
jgi:hypothetical protein